MPHKYFRKKLNFKAKSIFIKEKYVDDDHTTKRIITVQSKVITLTKAIFTTSYDCIQLKNLICNKDLFKE